MNHSNTPQDLPIVYRGTSVRSYQDDHLMNRRDRNLVGHGIYSLLCILLYGSAWSLLSLSGASQALGQTDSSNASPSSSSSSSSSSPSSASSAQGVAGVGQWKVEFDRARALSRDDSSQINTLRSMIDSAPELAQVWFYGEVFSLATPNLAVQRRTELLSTLRLIARRLSEQGVHGPMLLLEETQNDGFSALSKRTNQLQDRLFSQSSLLVKFENRLNVCLELIGQDILGESTYYALLHRALLRTGAAVYMPNSGEELAYLRAALPLAECEIILRGDTRRWSLLKRYLRGEEGATTVHRDHARSLDDLFRGGTLLEQNLKLLWEHWESESWRDVEEVMQSLIDILKAKRTRSARLSLASLYINKSLFFARNEELSRATGLLERVIESFVEVDQPILPTLLRLLLTSFLAESGQWDQAQVQLELLLDDPAVFESSRSSQRHAVLLTQQIVKAIETLHESRRDSEAINLFAVTLRLFSTITNDRYAKLLLPSELRRQDLLNKQLERASFYALTSRIYEASGQLDKARAQLEEARKSHPQPEAARGLILAWKLEQARLTLVDGGVDESITQLVKLSETLYTEQRRSTLASTAQIISEAFHARGSDRVAFRYANYGLELLSGAESLKGSETLHAQLHASAAQALAGLGYLKQAFTRLSKSLALHEMTTQRFRVVWLHLSRGELALALKVLDKAESLPLQKQIIRGCIFARQERYQEALEALQAYTLTSAPRASIEGRMCLIYAHTMSKQRGDIDYVGRPLASLMRKVQDPRYDWRVIALKALKLAQRGQGEESWNLALDALTRWRALGSERLKAGWHLEVPVFALPRTPLSVLRAALNAQRESRRLNADRALKLVERERWLVMLERPALSTREQLVKLVRDQGETHVSQLQDEMSLLASVSARLLSRSAQQERAAQQTKRHAELIGRPAHAALIAELTPSLRPLTPVQGALNWVFFEHNRELYRFELTADGPRDLKALGAARRLKTRLKRWEAQLQKSLRWYLQSHQSVKRKS